MSDILVQVVSRSGKDLTGWFNISRTSLVRELVQTVCEKVNVVEVVHMVAFHKYLHEHAQETVNVFIQKQTNSCTVNKFTIRLAVEARPLRDTEQGDPEHRYRIKELMPSCGPTTGGRRVVLHGENFSSQVKNLACTFGSIIIPVKVMSSTKIECITPPHPPGAVELVWQGTKLTSDGQVYTYIDMGRETHSAIIVPCNHTVSKPLSSSTSIGIASTCKPFQNYSVCLSSLL